MGMVRYLQASVILFLGLGWVPHVQPACTDRVDLAFIVDSSGSICDNDYTSSHYKYNTCSDFVKVKDFMRELVKYLGRQINPDGIRVALIQFASESRIVWDFNSLYHNAERVANGITHDVIYVPFQWTHLADALKLMKDTLFTSASGDRPEARNVAVVISDGLPTPEEQKDRTLPEARAARAQNIKLFTIGITREVDLHMLREISSEPHERDVNYFVSPITAGIGPPIKILNDDICFDPYVTTPRFTTPAKTSGMVNGRPTRPIPPVVPTVSVRQSSMVPTIPRPTTLFPTTQISRGPNFNSSTPERPIQQNEFREHCGDIIFLIDTSGSVCDRDPSYDSDQKTCATWRLTKEFMRRLASSIPVSQTGPRVGIVQFGSRAEIIWYLNEGTDQGYLQQKISGIRYRPFHKTYLADGLRLARTQLVGGPGDRADFHNTFILITDAQPTKGPQSVRALPEANLAKAEGAYIFSVSITADTNTTLLRLLSSWPQKEHVSYYAYPIASGFEQTLRDLTFNLRCSQNSTNSTRAQSTTMFPTSGPGIPSTAPSTPSGVPSTPSGNPAASPSPSAVEPSTVTTITPFTTCGEGLDLAILVDLSGSVCDMELDFRDGLTGCDNFRLLREFLVRMVSGLNIGTSDDSDRVSIVTFNGTATVRWRLDRYYSIQDQSRAIMDISYVPYQTTNIAAGLQAARLNVFGRPGDRPDNPNIVLLVTDGFPEEDGRGSAFIEAEESRRSGMVIIVVGITENVFRDDIKRLSSPPQKYAVTYFLWGSFESLPRSPNFLTESLCGNN